jgi:hypothetical protein
MHTLKQKNKRLNTNKMSGGSLTVLMDAHDGLADRYAPGRACRGDFKQYTATAAAYRVQDSHLTIT